MNDITASHHRYVANTRKDAKTQMVHEVIG